MVRAAEVFKAIPKGVEVAVVGAGFAGLTAARRLARAGKEVAVFDPLPDPGGRVRTLEVNDHLLDLGFQVLLTGYPAVREELDLDALELGRFEPGVVIVRGGRHHSLPDPFRTPHRWLEALRFPFASLRDKLKTRSLRERLTTEEVAAIFAAPATNAADWLRDQGFSERYLSAFWIPFFSAVFLDPPLEVSSRMLQFVFRSMAWADIALPSRGMGEAPRQIAVDLPIGAYHPRTRVHSLQIENGKVRGLSIGADGAQELGTREVSAETVILAAGIEEVRELTGLDLPLLEPLGVSVIYFSVPHRVTDERRIFLNGGGSSPGHHCVALSNICPTYAPEGRQLLEVTVLGVPEAGDEALAERARRQMATWFPGGKTETWEWLATYKIPLAQFRQPPGLLDRLPRSRTSIRGLWLAGDYTRNSSVQGAIESGQIAAREVLEGD